jgi:hypothetical protein
VLTFVVQIRNGSERWRGVVQTWTNSNGVHGRRFDGRASGQFQVGDHLIKPGSRSVVVVQRDCCTRNDPGRSRRGKYFWFHMAQWQNTFGSRGTKRVVQSRNMLTIWRGDVRTWDNNRDGDGHHGRRENSAGNNQFRTGDVLSLEGQPLANPWHPDCIPSTSTGYWANVMTRNAPSWSYEVTTGTTTSDSTSRESSWETSVTNEISGTLNMGGVADIGHTASITATHSTTHTQSASSAVSSSIERSASVTRTLQESGAGTLWQFAVAVRDSCGPVNIETDVLLKTPSGSEPPCCPPGRFMHGPDYAHGPCTTRSECDPACPAAVCDGTAPGSAPTCPPFCINPAQQHHTCANSLCSHCVVCGGAVRPPRGPTMAPTWPRGTNLDGRYAANDPRRYTSGWALSNGSPSSASCSTLCLSQPECQVANSCQSTYFARDRRCYCRLGGSDGV